MRLITLIAITVLVSTQALAGNNLKLKNLNNNIKSILDNKIVLIENADPGYDWIFGYKISGLVTKYGGINSHMSIRCMEQNIPAAIGIGEKKFNFFSKCKKIQLDCGRKKIIKLY